MPKACRHLLCRSSKAGAGKKYTLSDFPKPSYLQADFNGDAIVDIIALVAEGASQKKGLLLLHGKTGAHFVFGAGNAIDGSDNFNRADKWSLCKNKVTYETRFDKESGDINGGTEVNLTRPGILIED